MEVRTNLLLLEDLLIRVSLWEQDKWLQGNSPAHSAQTTLPTTARGRRLAQEESHGGVGEGDLASQLHCLQRCGLFCVRCFWTEDHSTATQLNQGPDLEDKRGDGVPRQEHRGEGLQEVQVPDRGCRHCWWQFYCMNCLSVCFSANLFLIQ